VSAAAISGDSQRMRRDGAGRASSLNNALLPAGHMEAWRAALAATGRTADGIEVALVDGYFRVVSAEGIMAPEDDSGLALLSDAVAGWTARTISRAGAAARRGP
jgi:hypothetical protein